MCLNLLHVLTCTHSLKKVQEIQFHIILIDATNPAIDIQNLLNQRQESKHTIYLDVNNLYSYAIFEFLQTSECKWIHPREFDLNKYTSHLLLKLKRCALKVDFEYLRGFHELNNDYSLASDKLEIKIEISLEH